MAKAGATLPAERAGNAATALHTSTVAGTINTTARTGTRGGDTE
jgi:hypothetical protein